jgi:hypothetical protein
MDFLFLLLFLALPAYFLFSLVAAFRRRHNPGPRNRRRGDDTNAPAYAAGGLMADGGGAADGCSFEGGSDSSGSDSCGGDSGGGGD